MSLFDRLRNRNNTKTTPERVSIKARYLKKAKEIANSLGRYEPPQYSSRPSHYIYEGYGFCISVAEESVSYGVERFVQVRYDDQTVLSGSMLNDDPNDSTIFFDSGDWMDLINELYNNLEVRRHQKNLCMNIVSTVAGESDEYGDGVHIKCVHRTCTVHGESASSDYDYGYGIAVNYYGKPVFNISIPANYGITDNYSGYKVSKYIPGEWENIILSRYSSVYGNIQERDAVQALEDAEEEERQRKSRTKSRLEGIRNSRYK